MFFPKHITSWLPLASMAQKNSSFPNEAEIGPMVPNPLAEWKNKSRGTRKIETWCMVEMGFDSWKAQQKRGAFMTVNDVFR